MCVRYFLAWNIFLPEFLVAERGGMGLCAYLSYSEVFYKLLAILGILIFSIFTLAVVEYFTRRANRNF